MSGKRQVLVFLSWYLTRTVLELRAERHLNENPAVFLAALAGS